MMMGWFESVDTVKCIDVGRGLEKPRRWSRIWLEIHGTNGPSIVDYTNYEDMKYAVGSMYEQVGATPHVTPSESGHFQEDPNHLRTVVATPAMAGPWINLASLKLKHRIGRGPFSDVWLATHHLSGDDFDEYHEVAA